MGGQGSQGTTGAQGTTGSQGTTGAQGATGTQGAAGPSTAINATAVTTGTFYPVFVAAAGSNQTPSVRTASTAFSFNAATNVLQVTATTAQYADLAEKYSADRDYAPGTVVSFGGNQEITMSVTDSDRTVAGVISTKPSYVMNAGLEAQHPVLVTLQGRVPVSVIGNVRKGDMMVSAGNGVARSDADPRTGALLGKSLEDFTGSDGLIEIVVGRL